MMFVIGIIIAIIVLAPVLLPFIQVGVDSANQYNMTTLAIILQSIPVIIILVMISGLFIYIKTSGNPPMN